MISVQGPALRAVPVASCLHQSSRGSPCSLRDQGVRISSMTGLYSHSLAISCAHIGTWCSDTLASWVFGSTGKRATCANSEDLFSRHGVGFGQPDSTPHPGTCSVGAELPQDFIRQDGGPTDIFQRLLGHMAAAAAVVPLGLLHMRPLQHWLHGRVPRWAWQCVTHQVQITPACRRTFSPWTDPSFPRAGIQECCGIHGCLGHRLGCH